MESNTEAPATAPVIAKILEFKKPDPRKCEICDGLGWIASYPDAIACPNCAARKAEK